MSEALIRQISNTGRIPLTWAVEPQAVKLLNLGDALSPVITAMVAGLPIDFAPTRSIGSRLAAVGTIGHMLRGGDISLWGTGSSPYFKPTQLRTEKGLYRRSPATRVTAYATRGPLSRLILAPDAEEPAVFGDPIWLMPRFHPAPQNKRYKLGVILHLAQRQLAKTEPEKGAWHRYQIPPELADSIVLIDTMTEPTIAALRERLDLILSCKRIVSTSLHGLVLAEAYGIPCAYFSRRTSQIGPGRMDLDDSGRLDLRFVDLYRGLGLSHLDVWFQPYRRRTPWRRLMRSLNQMWSPKPFDGDRLIEAFPLAANPLLPESGASAFDHPVVKSVPTVPKRDLAHKMAGVQVVVQEFIARVLKG